MTPPVEKQAYSNTCTTPVNNTVEWLKNINKILFLILMKNKLYWVFSFFLQTKEFILSEMLAHLYSSGDQVCKYFMHYNLEMRFVTVI